VPKLKGPLFSFSAVGSVSPALTFQDTPAGPRVITRPTHPDALTPRQVTQRLLFLEAAHHWSSLSAAAQSALAAEAAPLKITGYNLCLRRFLNGQVQGDCRLLLPMLEGHGLTCFDLSGYGNHAAITGATWTEVSPGLPVLSFDGVNDKAIIPHHTSLDITANITLELLFRRSVGDTEAWAAILSKGTNAQAYTLRYIYAPPSTAAEIRLIGVEDTAAVGWTHGTWWHMLGTFDPLTSSLDLYRNARLVSHRTKTGTIATTAADLSLASYPAGASFIQAELLAVRVLASSMTPTQVSKRFVSLRRLFPSLL